LSFKVEQGPVFLGEAPFPPVTPISIDRISRNRVTYVGKVDADLVGPTCFYDNREERKPHFKFCQFLPHG